MKIWQKAVIGGGIVELTLLLTSAVLLMSSIGPLGPEGFRAQLSEYLQFPGCQLMEKIQIRSFPITVTLMFGINFVVWTIAAHLFLCLSPRQIQGK